MVMWIIAAIIILVLAGMGIYGDYKHTQERVRETRALKAAADSWNKASKL